MSHREEGETFWASAIGHAAKFDKDTFVVCLIVICAFLSLIAGVYYATVLVTALALMAAYAIFRAWLLQTQIKERIFQMKIGTPEQAKGLSDELSTEAEKKLMIKYSDALEYQRSKEGPDGRH